MDLLKPFLRYWSLTLAVFVFYLFAFLVAALDVFVAASEAARKKRAERKPAALDPNPLRGQTVAKTILPGPGQQLDPKREWVARLTNDIVRRINPTPPVRALVLEDSKGHPLVHFSNGKRLESYRVDRVLVDAAMAGDTSRVAELSDLLTRHLTADFLGTEDARPPRTTELAREAGAKSSAASAAPASPAAAGDVASTPAVPAPAPASSAAPPAVPAAPAAPVADTESMSREERLAAARAKAEALRAARLPKPPAS
ncbi:MAG: hypothetical protein ACT4P5_02335 [Armatimonadota bacterium]